MINITIYKDSQNSFLGFEILGHAGADVKGKDLVCCAVSSIVQTALMGIENIAKIDAHIILKEGNVKCTFPLNYDQSLEKANIIVGTMVLGLKSLQQSYGGYIDIKEEVLDQ